LRSTAVARHVHQWRERVIFNVWWFTVHADLIVIDALMSWTPFPTAIRFACRKFQNAWRATDQHRFLTVNMKPSGLWLTFESNRGIRDPYFFFPRPDRYILIETKTGPRTDGIKYETGLDRTVSFRMCKRRQRPNRRLKTRPNDVKCSKYTNVTPYNCKAVHNLRCAHMEIIQVSDKTIHNHRHEFYFWICIL
jgi:hypothetical protein